MELIVVCSILIAATALRVHGLSSELWYDEIVTYLQVAHRPLAQIVTTYDSQNQHLLYSVLARIALAVGGDNAAALRTPALVFGVASLAALHALGRQIVSKREALLATALVAVSYHHVWFSQNARGYTALLFFALVSTSLVLRALAQDRVGPWIAYALAAALGTYAHLTMLLVVAGHLVVVLGQRTRRAGAAEDVAPLWGPALGFGALAALVLLSYAPVFAQVARVTAVEGRDAAQRVAWNTPGWAADEFANALRAAFAGSATPICALVLGLAGAVRLARSRPIALELFVLPVIVTVAALLLSAHTLWPRYLFFAIGFAALLVVAGAFAAGESVARWIGRPRAGRTLATAISLALTAASATSLPPVYAPKQRFAEAVALIERDRSAADSVVVIGRAQEVFAGYYRTDWSAAQSADELRAHAAAGRTWAVYAFPVELASSYPDVQDVLRAKFEPVAQFAGTLHGGEVVVWRSSPSIGARNP